jgi:ketosteroid isomerase-like protein
MDRRTFFSAAAALAAAPPAASQIGAKPATAAEVDAVKQRLVQWYKAFGDPRVDRAHYRSFMTDDYLLLEHGQLLDLAGDLAMLDALAPDHQRSDAFDFRYVRIDGDHAYAAYFLESEMTDSKNGPRNRHWLESAVLRKIAGQWRAAVLHSTRTSPPKTG